MTGESPEKNEYRNSKYSRNILKTGNSMGSAADENDYTKSTSPLGYG